MDYSNVVIITDPNITALYIGQLVKLESLPDLLEKNCVTLEDIEIVPYDKDLHEKYIVESKTVYSKGCNIKYSRVF